MTIVPILEERLVVEKQLYLKEELAMFDSREDANGALKVLLALVFSAPAAVL